MRRMRISGSQDAGPMLDGGGRGTLYHHIRPKSRNVNGALRASPPTRPPRSRHTTPDGMVDMALEKAYRRLPLRDLMTDAEKRARDIAEHYGNTWMSGVNDLRDLSRPIRRKSHYPTLLALQNAMQKMLRLTYESEELIEYLEKQLTEIRDHARRERMNRN